MMIFETSCVVQWPRNLTDETLIQGQLTSDDVNDEFSMMIHNKDKGILNESVSKDKFFE